MRYTNDKDHFSSHIKPVTTCNAALHTSPKSVSDTFTPDQSTAVFAILKNAGGIFFGLPVAQLFWDIGLIGLLICNVSTFIMFHNFFDNSRKL